MTTGTVIPFIENCESCGWNHEEVEMESEMDYYNGETNYYTCLLTKKKVIVTDITYSGTFSSSSDEEIIISGGEF
jgi:hypothetical protein